MILFSFTHDHEHFEMCGVLPECKSRTMKPLKTFGNKVELFSIALNMDHVGCKFRLSVKIAVSQLFYVCGQGIYYYITTEFDYAKT